MKPRTRHRIAEQSAHLALNKISFRIVPLKWSAVAEIMQGLNVDPQTLLEALKTGHAIEIDVESNPELFFVFDSEMRQRLFDANFREPTLGQLVGTSRCISTTEADARARFTAMFLENQN